MTVIPTKIIREILTPDLRLCQVGAALGRHLRRGLISEVGVGERSGKPLQSGGR